MFCTGFTQIVTERSPVLVSTVDSKVVPVAATNEPPPPSLPAPSPPLAPTTPTTRESAVPPATGTSAPM
jgi:hypothetical protein